MIDVLQVGGRSAIQVRQRRTKARVGLALARALAPRESDVGHAALGHLCRHLVRELEAAQVLPQPLATIEQAIFVILETEGMKKAVLSRSKSGLFTTSGSSTFSATVLPENVSRAR